MKMTVELLRELGTCGGYRDTFKELFPKSEYPDGVEVTADVCAANADKFDWHWAADTLLTSEAAAVWRTQVDGDLYRTHLAANTSNNERRQDAYRQWQQDFNQPERYTTYNTGREAREAYNTIDREFTKLDNAQSHAYSVARARAFGALFEEPQNQNSKLERLLVVARQRAERAEREELSNAELRVKTAQVGIENSQRELERFTTDLPLAERALVEARATFTARQVERVKRTAAEALEAVKAAEATAAEALAAKTALDEPATSASDATSTDAATATSAATTH